VFGDAGKLDRRLVGEAGDQRQATALRTVNGKFDNSGSNSSAI